MTHRLAIGVAICSMAMALFSVAVAQEHTPTPAEAGVLGLLETKAAASGQNLVLVDHVTLGALKDEGFRASVFRHQSQEGLCGHWRVRGDLHQSRHLGL